MKKWISWTMTFVFLMGLMACQGSKNEKKNIEVFVDSMITDSYEQLDSTVAGELSDSILAGERPDSSVANAHQEMASIDEYQAPDDPFVPKAEQKTTSKRVYASSTDGYVNVRKQPSVKSDILGKLVIGDQGAEYVKTEGEWYQIKYQGQTGYVKSTYASFDNNSTAAANNTSIATANNTSTATASNNKPTADNNKPTANNGQKHMFFVVIASFENLDRAKAVDNQLGKEFKSPIYKYVENGTVRYRICEGKYDSKDKARSRIQQLDEKFGKSDLWIWETSAEPICVFKP